MGLVLVQPADAQRSECPGNITGTDCTLFAEALEQFTEAGSLDLAFNFFTEVAMGNMSNQTVNGSAAAYIELNDDGEIVTADLLIDPITVETAALGGLGGSVSTSLVGAFTLLDGTAYFGYGESEDSLVWFRMDMDSVPLTGSLPTEYFSMQPSVVGAWERVDDLQYEDEEGLFAAYESYVTSNTTMTEGLAMLGGLAGEPPGEAAGGALFGGMMGMGFDSEFPSLAEYYGSIIVDQETGNFHGYSTVSGIQVDISNMMGDDIFGALAGSTGSMYTGTAMRIWEYDPEVFDVIAPEQVEAMPSGLEATARLTADRGLVLMVNAVFTQIASASATP